MKKNIKKSGFTLIEILVVIGIIAILAAVVLVAINPARQFAQARDTQRTSNLNTILNAIGQKMADCKGNFSDTNCGVSCTALPPGSAAADAKDICTAIAGCPVGGIDLTCLTPTYVSALPLDPSGPTTPATGYKVYQDTATGRVHVLAPVLESILGAPRNANPIEIVR